MTNLLNSPVDFQVTPTNFGVWKRYLYASGGLYQEFTSHARILGYPFFQYTTGRNPATGKIGTAKGVIAVGQKAKGFLAIGQAALGVVAVGQLAVGLLAGIGQVALGFLAVGQAAAGVIAVGQMAAGGRVLGQFSVGKALGLGKPLSSLFREG